jgi:hypothetical protein
MQDHFPTRLLAAAGSGWDVARWVCHRLLLARKKQFFKIHGTTLDILWMGMIYSLLRRYERCSASVRCRGDEGDEKLEEFPRTLQDFPKFAQEPLTSSQKCVIITGHS